jgi:hypothetical protein
MSIEVAKVCMGVFYLLFCQGTKVELMVHVRVHAQYTKLNFFLWI